MVVLMWPVVERSFRGGLWLGLGGAVGLLVADNFMSKSGDSAIARLLGGGSAGASASARADLMEHYWNEFLERPLRGSGFEEAERGHNVWLQGAYSMGSVRPIGSCCVTLAGG